VSAAPQYLKPQANAAWPFRLLAEGPVLGMVASQLGQKHPKAVSVALTLGPSTAMKHARREANAA